MKKTAFLLLALACAACGKPADKAAAAKRGQPAPQVTIEKMLQGDLKSLKSWDELKGKAVVLEFWGTDCGPCVDNIGHMNELVEKFKDKPVVFIQVSKEQEATVKDFLGKHVMKGNVAAEAGAAFKSFRIFGIPHAALIDAAGVFRGGLHPAGLDGEKIEALLAGRDVTGVSAREEKEAGDDECGEKDLAYFSAGPAGEEPEMSYSDTSFVMDGLPLEYVIETLMRDTHEVKFTDVPEATLRKKVRVSARVAPSGKEDSFSRMRDMIVYGLNAAMMLEILVKEEERPVLVLKKSGGPGAPAKSAARGGSRKSGHGPDGAYMEAKGAGVDDLAVELEDWLGRPVVDETGLAGDYDYRVAAKTVTPEEVNKALAPLGLKLEEGRRRVEVTEVRALKKRKG